MIKRVPDWLTLTVLATGLRLFRISSEQLWFDEAFTAWTVRPGTDFWRAVLGDNHPPLWNLIEAITVRALGQSALTMRLPAMIFGVGAVLLVWAIASYLLPRHWAFTAGLLAACLPAAVYFSQDARMYSALAFFVLLCGYGAIRRNDLIYMIGGLGAVYTQNAGVCYVAAIGLSAILWRRSWRPVLASIGLALSWLPWASVVLHQVANVKAGYWVPPLSPGGALYPGLLSTVGWRMAEGVQVPMFGIIIGVCLLTIYLCRDWYSRPLFWPLAAMVAGGPLLLLAFSATITNVWVYRAMLPAGMALCVLWAFSLHRLQGNARYYVRLALAFAIGVALLSHYVPVRSRPDVIGWLAPVRAGWQDGDLIYYLNATDAVGYGAYAGDLPWAVRPTPASLLTITQDCREAFGLIERPLEQVSAQRIWVTFNKTPYTTQDEVDYLATLLKRPYRQVARDGDSTLYVIDLIHMIDVIEVQ